MTQSSKQKFTQVRLVNIYNFKIENDIVRNMRNFNGRLI